MQLPRWTIFGICVWIVACLEAPGSPEISSDTPEISICLFQADSSCGNPLQASPTDSFTLYAKVTPSSYTSKLSFIWKTSTEKTLQKGSQFSTDTSRVPDSLIILDNYENRLAYALDFIFDTAPVMKKKTVPADGDTLFGDSTTAFLFEYFATDADKGDSLFYTLVLDSTEYFAGTLTSVYQSGFAIGNHQYRILVEDAYGLKDSTDWISFTVQEEK
ncbi:MAG: hypothetical protein J6Z31_05535 [Fibrobacter sp.]|nr:hypothetical protein [Fibrobacter sp.]